MTDQALEGHCQCGAVRYRMATGPMFVHACHCSECQRLSGSAFALNAIIEADRIERLAGEMEAVPVIGKSGKPQAILRCARCKVALWSHYPGAGPAICFIRVGTLDEPARLPPDIHIYTSTRLPWLDLPEGIPAVAEFYSAADHWPEESRQRWRHAQKKESPRT